MVTIKFEASFEKTIQKIKNQSMKIQLKKQIKKIIDNPNIGKPMRYARKNIRELYIKPLRLSYSYIKEEDKLIFIDLYHKDEQ